MIPIYMALGLFAAVAATPGNYRPGGDEYEPSDGDRWIPAIVRIDGERSLDSLRRIGAKVLRHRGGLALTYLPRESAAKSVPGLYGGGGRGDLRRRAVPTLDVARHCFGADRILTGAGLPRAFTGKGVVVGWCDIGLDATHPNFRTPDGRQAGRIKRLVQYRESQGERRVIDSPEEMARWRTDTVAEDHGTHVGGIIAGSDNWFGYRGIASDADIVVTLSELSDVGLLAGVEDIIEYARSVGKPAVVNLSMGNYTGPHDGTDLMCQYLDMLGEEAVICVSAGNEGNRTNAVRLEFSDGKPAQGIRLGNYSWNQFHIQGMTDVWSLDDRPVDVTVCVYDETTRETVWSVPVPPLRDGESYTLATPQCGFAGLFEGRMILAGDISPDNGRYELAIGYDLTTEQRSQEGAWARYNIAFEFRGADGVVADVYADGIYTRLRGMPGGPEPTTDLSFSNMATGRNTISVGMYTSRETAPLLNGDTDRFRNVEEGTVNVNSGYATLTDGRVMPLTVAPGAIVVSSSSSPYAATLPDVASVMAAAREIDGEVYYWRSILGTSMSSPYVAGFIATWLEADPTLTLNEIRDIIETTNRHDIADPANPRHGRGWFDPYAGLREVLRRAPLGVDAPETDGLRLVRENGGVAALTAGAGEVELCVYDMLGRLLHRASGAGPRLFIPLAALSSLSSGCLIVKAETLDGDSASLKIIQ